MKKIIALLITTFFFIAGCSDNSDDNNQEESPLPAEGLEVIADNLEVPWSIEKIEDTFYLTERSGNIVKIEDGEVERQRVELEEEVSTASEAGLLGFVLAPDFSESNLAYAYYTYEDGEEQFNRIVTLRLKDSVWREEDLLLDQIPSGTYHHGGRLKIGPGEKLYATAGDASDPEIAQDLDSLGGKILRINLDGSIPDDNPFADSYVYSFGHRNPQGMTWLSDGTMYASEHGDNANDEINLIEAGQNYGWPVIEGSEEQEGMVSPLFTSGDNSTWAPSGMDNFAGKLYVAALRGSAVLEFDLETGEYREVITGLGRIRDVQIKDDDLYFISNNTDGRGNPQENDDKLYRISLLDLN
ncbi:quinoprotein glucose dehydrogenase [Halobacillus litoralis]|uniref:Quinoprotein glucose dehydrogenase n=1 Tax=Halobacillus litoralis TaxID=45668 RepID=A0A845DY09_9BACI|nr:sorbosone dehydrogenase family protein [Halobacillus litoralis]MYL48297.1 quinoprotein glucose dehydrogenase [Halobacillus litoralis]